jgi:hypothetical protein
MRTWGAALAGAAMALGLGGGVQAAQLCGWMLETRNDENFHHLEIWLEADQDMDFFYKIGGEGLVEDSGGKGNSPNSGAFVLHRGKAEQIWGFGMTLYPPGRIDVTAEIHVTPQDIFSDEETPLIAAFAFQRPVPADETTPPQDLAKRQCVTVSGK